MPAFRHRQWVRFGDVDNAGIVYYPRFFHYFHCAFEDMFGTPADYARLINDRKIGFPAVHTECDFKRPLRYGDEVDIAVTAPRVGNKSVTFRYELATVGDRSPCAIGTVVTAVVDMAAFQPMPLPDDLRRRFEALNA